MTASVHSIHRNRASVALLAVLVIVAIARICSTYSVFWQTWDEPCHIAAGMEWLEHGTYTNEPLHPPLARVLCALGPFLAGVRGVDGTTSTWTEGTAILQSGGGYERNLTLARLGILVPFTIVCLVVALWGHISLGWSGSILATLLFSTLPPILAHAGLATLDLTCATFVTAATYALVLVAHRPTAARAALAGVAAGLAVLSKMSSIGFLLVAGAVVFAVLAARMATRRTTPEPSMAGGLRRAIPCLFAGLLACGVTVWSGYRFSLRPLRRVEDRPYMTVDRILGKEGRLHDLAYAAIEKVPVPAPEFFEGLHDLRERCARGHLNYLLGDIRRNGWWYFFPVVVLTKTPIPYLLLFVVGIGFLYNNRTQFEPPTNALWVAAIVPICLVSASMLSSVNNGIRQILVVYPPMSIIAAYGALQLVRRDHQQRLRPGSMIVASLLVWQIVVTTAAHPDYLPYFNELALGHPERIAVDSDLDWGQDLKRLASTMKRRAIPHWHYKYFGTTGIDFDQFGFPPHQELQPYQQVTGWVAISVFYLQAGQYKPPHDQFAWLRGLTTAERVGSSIWLYSIPAN